MTVERYPVEGSRFRKLSGPSISKYIRRGVLCLYAWPRSLRTQSGRSSLFDFSLLKDRLFLMFTTSVMLASFGYLSVYLILPSHAQDLGISKVEAVSLVSIMGICDLIGRVAFGWFSDFNIIPRKLGFCFMIIMAGLGNILVMFAHNFLQLSIFAGWFGFFGGSFMVLNAVLTADLFGMEKLPSAVGLLITIQGIAFLVGPPIVGLIRDETGSFSTAFMVIAIVMTAGAVLLPLETLIARLLRKRRRLSGESVKSKVTTLSDAE